MKTQPRQHISSDLKNYQFTVLDISNKYNTCTVVTSPVYIGSKLIHVTFSWAQVGRAAIFGRVFGVPDREIFFLAKDIQF